MFSIVIDLLTGRYTATAFDDRDAVEWPPHPARLLSALIAAWGDAEQPDLDVRSALVWLEAQTPPVLACSAIDDIAERAPVTVFVPDNDPTALARDVHQSSFEAIAGAERALTQGGDVKALAKAHRTLANVNEKARADAAKAARPSGGETAPMIDAVLEVLPEHRAKHGRSFPAVVPDDSTIWMTWEHATPSDGDLATLEALCARVGRLGHSSTFVSCRLTTEAPPSPAFVPSPDGYRFLRVPVAGLLDALEHRFHSQAGTTNGPLPHADAAYREAGRSASSRRISAPLLGGDWIVFALPRPLSAGGPEGLHVSRALDLSRAVRGALLHHATEPVPEILSGHCGGHRPTAVSQRPHVAVVPLPDVAHGRSDGAILGIALVLPSIVTMEERTAIERCIERWRASASCSVSIVSAAGRALTFELGIARVDPAPAVGQWIDVEIERRATLRRSTWCRPSSEWASVTPIALDRFPGDLGSNASEVRETAEANARATIVRACTYAGIEEPETVEVDLVGFLAAVPPSTRRRKGSSFPTYRAGTSGQQRLSVHARIRFPAPVPGPVLIGAGRYLGYGLCLPLDQTGHGRWAS